MKTRYIMTVSVLAVMFTLCPSWIAPAYGQTILIDFGNASSWRGVNAPSPDVNGHFWNSVWSGAYYPSLIDINGAATVVNFGFSAAGGTDSYNGPAGVTYLPVTQAMIDATDIDAVALGNLGVKQAAMDYYVSSTFEIQNLDPMKTYNLTFFGSHKYSTDDATVYSVYTDNTYSSVVDSATLNHQIPGNPWMHNRDQVVTINDIDPQASNILWIKFIGSNGHEGYLNCIQIAVAPGVKARRPNPGSGAKNVPITTNLSWNKPSDYTPVKYVLRIRANDPNLLDPNHVTVVNPVIDLNLDTDPATVEAAAPTALNYNTKYYWNVTAFKLNDPNVFVGPTWSFTTAPELQVNAGPNTITWLNGGLAHINLQGSVSCQCTVNGLLWSVVSQPAGSNVSFASSSAAITSATFNKTGTYVLKLSAHDNSVPPIQNQDTVEIKVYADACEAAKNSPSGYTRMPHDSNDDCRVNFQDFVQFAADWLRDLSLTQNLEY